MIEAHKWKDVGLPNYHIQNPIYPLQQFITSSEKLMFPKQTSISFTETTFDEHFGAYSLLANNDQCGTKCLWTDISWQLPKESNWKCDWQKLNWRAHFLIYHQKGEQKKTNKLIISEKAPSAVE